MKPNKAVLSKFKITGTGKLMRRGAGYRHLLAWKSSKQKRQMSKDIRVGNDVRRRYATMLGLGKVR